jgi:hypothetical protein
MRRKMTMTMKRERTRNCGREREVTRTEPMRRFQEV